METKVSTLLFSRFLRSIYMGLSLLVVTLIVSSAFSASANAEDRVGVFHDANGWKMQVNGSDYYIKGVVWGYIPKGENYNYNLWGHSDEFIRKVLDHDFGLMQAAGVNTIRSFGLIPPRWITYIYRKFGIRTVVNHLFGRYGFNVNGSWRSKTNYADEATREALKNDFLETVRRYKDVEGVLMFALGNESNYGLEWSSFEIENLPKGEQQVEKAKYLYSLFNETIGAAKQIDAAHPYTIVNGDIQYLDLIRQLCPNLDLLGVNAYRGESFTGLWADVKKAYDKAVVMMEFGSDAFNARTNQEDQEAQAKLLRSMWLEMYQKSYGNGDEGNSIGGFTFEWRDEWWKYLQTENLDVHDRHASWANGGYRFDFVQGKNNMNEEWFGIMRLGDINEDGVYPAEPRMAYDVLAKIWAFDPLRDGRSRYTQAIESINMDFLALRSDVRALKSKDHERSKFEFTGGSLKGEMVVTGNQADIKKTGQNGAKFSDGEMLFLDFAFNPTNNIKGQFSLNVLGNVPERNITIAAYGDRGKPVVIANPLDVTGKTTVNGKERIEIYDFDATYENSKFKLTGFYHVPRYHWKYKGDFLGLMREATDMEGMDVWNAKAPSGVEFEGKSFLNGLNVVFGPEVYWGANPKVIVKYNFGGSDFTFMHAEDIASRSTSTANTTATERRQTQTALSMKKQLFDHATLELGAMIGNRDRIGDRYDYIDAGVIKENTIKFRDTLGFKAKASIDTGFGSVYLAGDYFGLVSDGAEPLVEFETQLPYSDLGNKYEIETGALLNFGSFTLFPRFLYRNNLRDANPTILPTTVGVILNPGINPRNRDSDPFAVLGNREARSAEITFTWDPTPATSFYLWDRDKREDASLAFNLAFNYTKYPTPTDAYLFYFTQGARNAPFASGLSAANVWSAKAHFVANPHNGMKLIGGLWAGLQQSTGLPGPSRRFYRVDGKVIINNKHIHSFYLKFNDWGQYDFQRQFDIVYPFQAMYEYSLLLDPMLDELKSSKWGLKALYRRLDANAPASEYMNGLNKYMFEITTSLTIDF